MFGPNLTIYKALFDKLILTDADYKELQTKRGFTDRTIELLGFKSALPANIEIIQKLVKEFGAGECFSCGLVDKAQAPAWQFTRSGMTIIPYFNSREEITFYKSHKYGNLPELGVYPYSEFLAAYYWHKQKYDDLLVVCESEFKAAAMWQLGWPAIGLGGVSAFSGQYHTRISEFLFQFNELQKLKFKRIIILFDTEIQDDPELKHYKQDYQRRYAQHVYSYVMAIRFKQIRNGLLGMIDDDEMASMSAEQKKSYNQLINVGMEEVRKTTLIASLPEEWAIDGKIDIDTALAQGHTRDEFDIVLRSALTPESYRYQMKAPKQHLPWINRQMDKANHNNIIFKYQNCYHININSGKGGLKHRELSNFVIVPKNTIIRDGAMYREVEIHSKFGDVSAPFEISPEDIGSVKSFKTKCLSKGDYIWKGSENDFIFVAEELFLESSGQDVYVLDLVGRDEEHKQWVFGNMILQDDGTILKPDEDGTFWDTMRGYKIKTLSEFSFLPILSEEKIDIAMVARKFEEAWGLNGKIAFVAALSSLFANEVFKSSYQSFPILMIHGERESGKSALADALYGLFGFGMHVPTKNITSSTPVGMTRGFNYYSSLPFRLDEYRNDSNGTMDKKDSILRSLYNRQGDIKGIKTAFGAKESHMRSTCFLIGEERPDDPALMSRCITIYLNKNNNNEKTAVALRWLYAHQNELSNVTYQILKKYKENAKQFINDVKATNQTLGSMVTGDFRAQLHNSIMMAMAGMILPEETAIEMVEELLDYFKKSLSISQESSILGKFFGDIYTMWVMGEPVHRFISRVAGEPNQAHFHISGIYVMWAQFKQRQGNRTGVASEKNVKDYVASQPYCINSNIKAFIPAKQSRVNCMLIDVAHPRLLKEIKDIVMGTDND